MVLMDMINDLRTIINERQGSKGPDGLDSNCFSPKSDKKGKFL